MLILNHEEKLKLMRSLNWDYLDTHEDMLAVIEGRIESSEAFNQEKLFVRSLERLTWNSIVGLWGKKLIMEMYTIEIAEHILSSDKKNFYDFALAILRREPLPSTEWKWGDEHYKQVWYPLLSDRFRLFEDHSVATSFMK